MRRATEKGKKSLIPAAGRRLPGAMKVSRVTLVVTVVMLLACTAVFVNYMLLRGAETAATSSCGAYLVTFRLNDGSDDYHWDYEHRGVRECVVRIYHTHRNAGYELTKRPGDLHDYDFYGSFLKKDTVLTTVMRTLADMHPDAVLVPLDDDEILRDPTGEPVTRESLSRLSDEAQEWKTGRAKMRWFTTRVCEKEGERMRFVGVKRRNVEMTHNVKTMFRAKSFEATDRGNHHGVTVETHGADHTDLAQYDISEFRMVDVSGDLTFGQWYDKIHRRYASSPFIPLEQCAGVSKRPRDGSSR